MERDEKKNLLKRYELDYEESREICCIGITGMLRNPIQLAGKMFGINPFLKVMVGRPYTIWLSYGNEITYSIKQDGEWKMIPEESWHQCMSGLTDEGTDESRLEARVLYPCTELQKVKICLISLEGDDSKGWMDDFWGIDRWCIVLSATKLLGSLEKEFFRDIKKYYTAQDYTFYLGDMEFIHEEKNRRYIGDYLDAFAGQFAGGFRVSQETDHVKEELFCGCEDFDAMFQRRDERTMSLQMCRLKKILKIKTDDLNKQLVKKQTVIDKLKTIENGIAHMEDDFGRQIRIYYLRELQQKIHQKMDQYDAQLQPKLMMGINEEDDFTALSENIVPFLLGEWEEYLQGGFAAWSADETEALNQELGKELNAKIEGLIEREGDSTIKETLYRTMERVYYDEKIFWEKPAQPLDLSDAMQDGQTHTIGLETGIMNHKAIPLIFIATGALAGITGALLPGLILAAIGVKSKMSQDEEKETFRKELEKEAVFQEKQILKYIKTKMDMGLEDLKGSVNQSINMQFSKIIDALQMQEDRLTAERDEIVSEAAKLEDMLQNIN